MIELTPRFWRAQKKNSSAQQPRLVYTHADTINCLRGYGKVLTRSMDRKITSGLFTGHDHKPAGRVRNISKSHGSDRIGSRRVGSGPVRPGRIRKFSSSHGSGLATVTGPDPTRPDLTGEVLTRPLNIPDIVCGYKSDRERKKRLA